MAQQNPARARHATHASYSDQPYSGEQYAERPAAPDHGQYGMQRPNTPEEAMNEVAQALGRLMNADQNRHPRTYAAPAGHHHAPQQHAPQGPNFPSRDTQRDPWHRSDLRSGLDHSASPNTYEDRYDPAMDQGLYARAGVSRDPLSHPRPPFARGQAQQPVSREPHYNAYAQPQPTPPYAEPSTRPYAEPMSRQAVFTSEPAPQEAVRHFAPEPALKADVAAKTGENTRVKRISSVLDALNALDDRLNSLAHNENEKGKGVPTSSAHAPAEIVEKNVSQPKMPQYGFEAASAPQQTQHQAYPYPPVTQADPQFNRVPAPHGVNQRSPQEPAAPMQQDTAAPIAELNTMINGHFKQLAGQIDTLREPDEERFEQLQDGMETQMNSLRDDMMERTSDNRTQLSEIIGRLRDEEGNGRLLKELRHELELMRSSLSSTDIEDGLKALGLAHESIQTRLQDLADKNVDPGIFESLTDRMADVEAQIRQLPRVDQLTSLENRLSSMGDRLEDVLHRSGAAGLEVVRDEISQLRKVIDRLDSGRMIHDVDQRIRFLTARMDELDHFSAIQRDIQSRLSNVETRMPDGETMDRLHGRLDSISNILAEGHENTGGNDQLNRLEERLSTIGVQLDRMEKTPEPTAGFDQAFNSIEGRLDHLCVKVDGIEGRLADAPFEVALNENESAALARLEQRVMSLTQMVENGSSSGSSDKALSIVRAEISELRGHIGALATSGDIEAQLHELASTISKPSGLTSDVEIDRLEQQIVALSQQLDASQSHFGSLGNLENSVGSIEQEIKGLHTDMVGKAQQIAQDAVKAATDKLALGNTDHQGEAVEAAISALRLDLQSLLEASGQKKDTDHHALQDVRDVLGTISNRLENLESIRNAIGDTEISQEHQKLVGDNQIGSILGAFTKGKKANAAAGLVNLSEANEPRNRKADFIAAARRAAKAAAKEAKEAKKEGTAPANGNSKAPERARRLRDYISPTRTENVEVPEKLRSKKAAATEKVLSQLQIVEEPVVLSAEDMVVATDTLVKEPINLSAGSVEVGDEGIDKTSRTKESATNRRRAIMLAAAALLLTIGTLQAFNSGIFSSSDSVDTAGADVKPSIMAPNSVMPGKDNSSLLSGGVDAVVAPDVVSRASLARPETELPSPVSSTSIWQTGTTSAPSEPTKDIVFGKATQIKPADRTASINTAIETNQIATGSATSTAGTPPQQMASVDFQSMAEPVVMQPPVQQVAPTVHDLPYAIGPADLRQAAISGDAAAQFEVARRYTEGNLVPSNLNAAAQWYRKSAAQGLAPAQYRLGSFYEKGRGLEIDLGKARDWYSLAAGQGNIKAMHNLAVLYVEGIDGPPNFDEAVKWFRIAADYGVADSKFNLAILAARGLGMKQNLVESYKWFALAAELGDEDAATKRNEVAASLTKRELTKALESVANFKIKAVDPISNKVELNSKWSGTPKTTVSQANVPAVKKLQQALLTMGYDPGNPDGVMGPNTRRAIKSLQARLGMAATGEPDKRFLMALASQTI
ncbi:localization factor PodJL [Pseudovibrio sp. Tun.PSC04-5.I4]|nr:localization factor PodJL [Pseudovibrio sp. Tun.PSC04-5.I4]